jgi:hypothetical protein
MRAAFSKLANTTVPARVRACVLGAWRPRGRVFTLMGISFIVWERKARHRGKLARYAVKAKIPPWKGQGGEVRR